jgi:tetratricopeptide (TPR) repeat protein
MALALPSAWFLWNRTEGRTQKIIATIGLAVLLTIIVLRTRSIWIGVFIWAIFAVLRNFRSWKPLATALFTGSLVLGVILSSPKTREALIDPTNLRIREVFWNHSIQMLNAHPISGVGAGQWRIHFPSYGLRGMNPSVAEGVTAEVRPHNDALWLTAEHGWPALFLWIILWGGLGISWWRLRKQEGADLVAGIALIVFTYSNFEFPIERAAVWIPFALASGMLRPNLDDRPKSTIWKPMYLGAVGLLTIGYGYTAVQGISSETDQQKLLSLNADQNALKLLPASRESLDDWTELDRFGNPSPYFAGMSSMFLEAQRGPITLSSFSEAEALFKQALALHPHHVVTWYQLANLYRYRGEPKKAEQAYLELLKRSPHHPGGQMHLAHSLLAQNRPEEAAAKLFGAFGDDAYYRQPDYRNATIQALRQCPDQVAMKGVQAVLNDRAALDDNDLFERFLAEKATWIGR